jgi:hypothetical protein
MLGGFWIKCILPIIASTRVDLSAPAFLVAPFEAKAADFGASSISALLPELCLHAFNIDGINGRTRSSG